MQPQTKHALRSLVVGAAAIFSLTLCNPATLSAQDWPNWRGPEHNGTTAKQKLPETFDQKTNVRWATDMPGAGASTPIVVGKRIYLSTVDAARKRLVALCLDLETGKTVWSQDAGSGYTPGEMGTRIARGNRTTYASPSPVQDGEQVIFFFGNGDLTAYGMKGEQEGKELWRRNIQKEQGDFAFQWTFSASPTLWDGRLYLPVMQRDEPVHQGRKQRRGRRRGGKQSADAKPSKSEVAEAAKVVEPPKAPESFLLAMDPATGKTLWRHVRPSSARKESLESYATIIPRVSKKGRKELVVVGGDVLTGHDPATGRELWRWGTWNKGHREQWWRIVPSVVLADEIALVCAPKREPVYAIELGGDGNLGEEALRWKSSGRPNLSSSDVPTPAFYAGHFYILNDLRAAITKVDAQTGDTRWSRQLSKDYRWRASPTICNGKLYFMNHNGQVVVVDCESGKIVHEAQMGEDDDDSIRSSIVIANNKILIRTNTKLYCIAE